MAAGVVSLRRATELGQWVMGDVTQLASTVGKLEGQAAARRIYEAAVARGLWKHTQQHPSQSYDPQLEVLDCVVGVSACAYVH